MAAPQRLTGPGSLAASAGPRPVSRRSSNQTVPLRQTALISPVRPLSPTAYPQPVHSAISSPVSTKVASPEPIASTAPRSGQTQTRHVHGFTHAVALQPRVAGDDTHEARFQELQAYIDTQIESIRSSNLVSPSSSQHVAEDFDSRLESAFNMIAQDQARKFEELHGTLEQRMTSLIEHRIEQAMQDMNASNEQNFQQFTSTQYNEIDQRLAQAGLQASEEARAIAAQAIEENKSSMHAHVSRDVGMSQEAAALLQQQHDDFSAKFQRHDDHVAMFGQLHDEHAALFRQHHDEFSAKFHHYDEHTTMLRQRQDEHGALLHQISRDCDELREIHAQSPAPTPNVTTDGFEKTIAIFREQTTHDVQCMVEDLMKKLELMTDNMTTERREREGNDSSLSERINALTANERNICARMDDLTMETKNMGQTAMALTAQVNSTSERSLDRSLEPHQVADPRYNDIMNQVQNLHSRFSEMEAQGLTPKLAVQQGNTNEIKSVLVGEGRYTEGGGVREIRDSNEVGPSPVRSAQGMKMSGVSEEQLRGLSEKSASLLDRLHKVSQDPSRTRDLAAVSPPVQSAQGVNSELLSGLMRKSSSLLDRMHNISQDPSRTGGLAIASADSNGDDHVMSKIQLIQAQAERMERRLDSLQTGDQHGQHKPLPEEKIAELLARVDNLETATALVYPEKFVELRLKGEELEGRLRSVEQEKDANLGWTDQQHISLKSDADKLNERLQKLEGAIL